jgi:hypothetical protein
VGESKREQLRERERERERERKERIERRSDTPKTFSQPAFSIKFYVTI